MTRRAHLLALGCSGLLASAALADAGGIAGYSGQNGTFCTHCHAGGPVPTVALTGPSVIAPGQVGDFTLTLTGGAAVTGGLDVSVAGISGATLVAGSGTQILRGELTHTVPKAFASGSVAWVFSVQAPSATGSLTLYAAGNSTNGDGTDLGDNAAVTTLSVTVGAVPDGGPSGPPDAGSSQGASDAGSMPSGAGGPSSVATSGASSGSDDVVEGQAGCAVAGFSSLAWSAVAVLVIASRRRPLPSRRRGDP